MKILVVIGTLVIIVIIITIVVVVTMIIVVMAQECVHPAHLLQNCCPVSVTLAPHILGSKAAR